MLTHQLRGRAAALFSYVVAEARYRTISDRFGTRCALAVVVCATSARNDLDVDYCEQRTCDGAFGLSDGTQETELRASWQGRG